MGMLLAHLMDVVDHLQVPIFVLSVEDERIIRFEKLNTVHEAATEIKTSAVVGKTPHDIFPQRMADTVMRNYMQCVTSKTLHNYEELLHFGGEETWWDTSLSPILDDGKVIGIVGVAYNKTASKTIESNLASAIREVSRVNTDLKLLTSTTAHDLRGPLRQAKILMDMIFEDFQDLGDNKKDLIETCNKVVDKALSLIDLSLGNVSRSILIDDNLARVDLGHWCSDIIAILDPLAKLDFAYPDVVVECEKFILDIGLRNLVDNAVKFADSRVLLEVLEKDGGLEFSVSNDGQGFAEDHRIGESPPKSQSTDPTSGIGLAATRSLLEARQGKLWINKPRIDGQGATLTFLIPGKFVQRELPE